MSGFNRVFDRGNWNVSEEVLTLLRGTHEEAREVKIVRLRRALADVSMDALTGNGSLSEVELADELRAYAESVNQSERE